MCYPCFHAFHDECKEKTNLDHCIKKPYFLRSLLATTYYNNLFLVIFQHFKQVYHAGKPIEDVVCCLISQKQQRKVFYVLLGSKNVKMSLF